MSRLSPRGSIDNDMIDTPGRITNTGINHIKKMNTVLLIVLVNQIGKIIIKNKIKVANIAIIGFVSPLPNTSN